MRTYFGRDTNSERGTRDTTSSHALCAWADWDTATGTATAATCTRPAALNSDEARSDPSAQVWRQVRVFQAHSPTLANSSSRADFATVRCSQHASHLAPCLPGRQARSRVMHGDALLPTRSPRRRMSDHYEAISPRDGVCGRPNARATIATFSALRAPRLGARRRPVVIRVA